MKFNVDESLILITTSTPLIISYLSNLHICSLSAGLPVLLVFIQSPHELLLVVTLLPRHVVPAGHHLVAHHLQAVEHLPGGDAELDPLLLLTVVLGLLLHLLRDGPHLVMVETLDCHPPLTDALSVAVMMEEEMGIVNILITHLTNTYGIFSCLPRTQYGLTRLAQKVLT